MTRRRFFGRRNSSTDKPASLANLARTANAANVQQGATAYRAGRTFEEELEQANAVYAAAGVATIARAHPPVGGPPNALYYRGKGQVDFIGTIRSTIAGTVTAGSGAPHGIPIAFDAKSNSDAASYKHDPRDYHELDFLLDWRRAGGVSFLLLLDRPIGTMYLVDDLDALRAGASIALRTHARGRSLPMPIVPALHRTESERTLDVALGRAIWPWLALARLQYPQLANDRTAGPLPPAA